MKHKKLVYIFDLDGTITAKETLPIISEHFNVGHKILELTKETVEGNIPFVESFIKRVNILGALPVDEINDLLSKVPLLLICGEKEVKNNTVTIRTLGSEKQETLPLDKAIKIISEKNKFPIN